MEKWKYVLILVFVIGAAADEACETGHKCVVYAKCKLKDEFMVVYPCLDGSKNKICCPDQTQPNVVSRTTAFPEKCGEISYDDKIVGGEKAGIGQFPWMTLLGYKQNGLPFVQFLCGGSVITEKFVLTAAHCVDINSAFELVVVRVGELNLLTDVDCEKQEDDQICADPHVDLMVEKITPHKDFRKDTLKNDIALVKTKGKITFTEYVRPLCLPFGTFFHPRTYFNETFMISGWGKIQSSKVGGSTDLLYASVTVWNQNKCNASVPPNVRPIADIQMCANGAKIAKPEDACKGDSGGPLFNTTFVNGQLRTYQLGIVSFAATMVCGNRELPTVYTRVDRYLDWIVANVTP